VVDFATRERASGASEDSVKGRKGVGKLYNIVLNIKQVTDIKHWHIYCSL